MHNPESVLENEMQKHLWDFEIQTDQLISVRWPDLVIVNKKKKKKRERTCWIMDFSVQLISVRRPDLVIVNKKKRKKRTCWIVDFTVQADHRMKLKESEKRDKYLDVAR